MFRYINPTTYTITYDNEVQFLSCTTFFGRKTTYRLVYTFPVCFLYAAIYRLQIFKPHLTLQKKSHTGDTKTGEKGAFSMCCNKGRVDIYAVPTPPPPLQRLFAKQDPLSSEFLKNIREYNAEFQMASSTANFEKFTSGVSQVLFIIYL